MPCYGPLRGYRSRERTRQGARSLVFSRSAGYADLPVEIPCGQCIGCRQEKSRQWAMRCMHEASLHDANCFVTLTYSDGCLPRLGSLDKRGFQLYMKRLRKMFAPRKVRFFCAGEYGGRTLRPHYHSLLFGVDFPDKELWSERNGMPVFRSRLLERLWPFGNSEIGSVTWQSAGYVAKYCQKKLTGLLAHEEYGEREPEFGLMSRKPGIGREWYERYKDEVYRQDSVVVNGKEMRPPKYYDNLMSEEDDKLLKRLKAARVIGIDEAEQEAPRLNRREDYAYSKAATFARGEL